MTISVHEKFKISSSLCYTENGIDSSNVLKFSSYFFLLIIDMGYIGPKYIVSKNSTFLLINKFQRKKKKNLERNKIFNTFKSTIFFNTPFYD